MTQEVVGIFCPQNRLAQGRAIIAILGRTAGDLGAFPSDNWVRGPTDYYLHSNILAGNDAVAQLIEIRKGKSGQNGDFIRPPYDTGEVINVAGATGGLNSAIILDIEDFDFDNPPVEAFFAGNKIIIFIGLNYNYVAQLAGITLKAGQ